MFGGKKKSQIPPVEDMRADLLGGPSRGSSSRAPPPSSSASSVHSGYSRPPPSYASGPSSSAPPAGYGAPASGSGYGGASGGYSGYQSRTARGGGGGWGQGATAAQATDAQRDELFRSARPPKENFGAQSLDAPYDQYGRGQDGEQNAYANEDDEVEAIKQQIRYTKQESLASTRNALRTARETEEVARATLTKLGDQTERIANTERSIDMAKAHNDRAADEAKEIKKLNRSIFRPSFTFNKQSKRDAAERRIVDRHITEREEREEVRRNVAESRDRIGGAFREMDQTEQQKRIDRYGGPVGGAGARMADRARYQFEGDQEDDELEQELDSNLDEIGDMAKRLNLLARAAGDEVASQNKKLGTLGDKTDALDTRIFQNTQRLQRIK